MDVRTTSHQLRIADARALTGVPAGSVHLVVTSPPYPMVAMWDDLFARLAPESRGHLKGGNGAAAFDAMHRELDRVWVEVARVLAPGGFACINVGDAVRTVGDEFRLYSNHARVIAAMAGLGLVPLPDVLWRKPTNAPNKFMGSGMLPAGAYVTYEHEYVLIFRKGGKRAFAGALDRERRARDAFFWEERNTWFSDVWADLPGARQGLASSEERARSAAFPFEIPFRLVCMYSLSGDTVLDPFAGTGTSMIAAAATGRNSVGIELDGGLGPAVERAFARVVEVGAARADARLAEHLRFVGGRAEAGRPLLHRNEVYGFPVVTGQERTLRLLRPCAVRALGDGRFEVDHQVGGQAGLSYPPVTMK